MGGAALKGNHDARVVVLGGGDSAERAVSLESSRAVFEALRETHRCTWIDVTAPTLPEGLEADRDVIFPVLHGGFGEGGELQAVLEEKGFAYAGCDARASRLCMDKVASKAMVARAGVPVARELVFEAGVPPAWEVVEVRLGQEVVLKPRSEGSSVGLHFISAAESWRSVTGSLEGGAWMVEPRIAGRDVTVGILDGEAHGVVGIDPEGGAPYDYTHKYTAGRTRYEVPAALPEALTESIKDAAEAAFRAVGGRDFARVDFLLQGAQFTFLEINTIPGLTAQSLLPKSASACGIDFPLLVRRMIAPAMERHAQRSGTHV